MTSPPSDATVPEQHGQASVARNDAGDLLGGRHRHHHQRRDQQQADGRIATVTLTAAITDTSRL